jgi:hypothetical protein
VLALESLWLSPTLIFLLFLINRKTKMETSKDFANFESAESLKLLFKQGA